MCINLYFQINLICSVSLLFYYEPLEFYFKVSIFIVSKRWECQKHYLHGFFIKNLNFPKFAQNLAQISQKVYESGLYFWFMKKPHTRSLALPEFRGFHGVAYFWMCRKAGTSINSWWSVIAFLVWMIHMHTSKLPKQNFLIHIEAN